MKRIKATWKARTAAIAAAALATACVSTAASAHLVTFGWKQTSAGTILYGEHWHGDLSAPDTANGGIHITDTSNGTTITAQWTGFINNTLAAALGLTGSFADPGNPGSGTYNDWMYTVAIPLGNGTYDFFTGTNCCIDTMTSPETVTITGITNQGGGIGNPGGVPEPATWAMMLLGFGAVGFAMRRRTQETVRVSYS